MGFAGLDRIYKTDFVTKDGLRLFSRKFNNSLSRVLTCEGVRQGGSNTQAEVHVNYWIEYVTEEMRFDFVELAVHHFHDGSSKFYEIYSFADQHASVMAEKAKVE